MPEEVEPTPALIIAARCYDLLAVIARGVNSEETERVLSAHERGIWFMPPPAFLEVIDDEVGE